MGIRNARPGLGNPRLGLSLPWLVTLDGVASRPARPHFPCGIKGLGLMNTAAVSNPGLDRLSPGACCGGWADLAWGCLDDLTLESDADRCEVCSMWLWLAGPALVSE